MLAGEVQGDDYKASWEKHQKQGKRDILTGAAETHWQGEGDVSREQGRD